MNTEKQAIIDAKTDTSSTQLVEDARTAVQESELAAQQQEDDARVLEQELEEAQIAEQRKEEAEEKAKETKAEIDLTVGG